MSHEEDFSDTTASSSGITNCDITILGHDDIRQTIKAIERELQSMNFTVAIPLCAARLKAANLMSRVGHARIIIIILTKKTMKDYQRFLAVLCPGKKWNIYSTLIMYEDGIALKRIHKIYQNIVRIKLLKDVSKITEQICCFIEAMLNQASEVEISETLRERYSELLLHSIINPCRSETAYRMDVDELEKRFNEKHGEFSNLLTGEIKERLNKSEGFLVEGNIVKQTPTGAKIAHEWYKNVKQGPTVFKSTRVDHQRIDAGPSGIQNNLSPINEDPNIRTNEWISSSDLPSLPYDPAEVQPLAKQLAEFDSRYSFFLISGKLNPSENLSGIINIPWLKVFDFDCDSRRSGFLSSVEETLKSRRGFSISHNLTNLTRPLLESATDWYFPRGFTDRQDTMFDREALQWYTRNKTTLEQQFLAIADFCVCRTLPVFLVLWYNCDEDDTKHLDWFLSCLYPAFKSDTLVRKVIICMDEYPSQNSALHHLITSKYQLEESTAVIPVSAVCSWLSVAKVSQLPKQGTIKLPHRTYDDSSRGTGTVEISKELLWIQEFIEILPLENLDEIKDRKPANAGRDFVKGGTVEWDELATGKIAVDRDVQSSVYESLKNDVLEECRSIVIKIRHSPGGGGTTFARQLLWYLHSDVPCGVALPNPTLSINHLMERVEFLHEKTLLPIVLLVDGRSDYEVDQLYESCKYAIVILHVQRHNQVTRNKYNRTSRTCHLPGSVTSSEAGKLAQVFSEFSPTSRNALGLLTNDVSHGRRRYMFEYGLTAFNHEFKGVRRYVCGYMELSSQGLGMKNLLPWQKVVAYLSLILYYGQGGMHRETFHKTLKQKSQDSFVTLNDLKFSGRQFILETANGEWKISYYVVAKEILEQVLSGSSIPELGNNLSDAARNNLHELVIDFIEMLKNAMTGNTSERVLKLLCDVILRRDYRDMDMSDAYGKKHSLSRLLEHVPDRENRIRILRKLTTAFPHYVEFHAHLGRLLNLMEKFDDAEKCLQKALEIRKKERRGTDPTWSDSVRGRIHHMFGFGYIIRAQVELEKAKRHAPHHADKLMVWAKQAVYHFREGRQDETHNLSYGYIGEVRARLLIAKYVHRRLPGGCLAAFNGELGREHIALCEFIRESHSECDQLLAECKHYTPDAELRKIDDYHQCVEKFNTYFADIEGDLRKWRNEAEINVSMRRSRIASLKMQHLDKRSIGHVICTDIIKAKKDITEVISLYEKTINETLFNDSRHISISIDMLEWLEAIRHPLVDDTYTLVTILNTVSNWESRNEVGYATFYLYVINFVLAVYSPGKDINMEYNCTAKELRERLKAKRHRYLKQRFSLEWLADHRKLTVRKLVGRRKLGTWDKENRFWKEPEAAKKLQVCTGTVIKSSHPLSGVISLDVPNPSRKFRVEVKFVPKLYDLVGSRFSEQSLRVEFFVGFSADHGAEALMIKKLERTPCRHCKLETETITLNEDGKGKCAKCHCHVR